MPYYAVANGRNKGVYTNWNDCKSQVNGYSGSSFKKFNTAAEAQSFASGGSSRSGSGGGGSSSSRSYSSNNNASSYSSGGYSSGGYSSGGYSGGYSSGGGVSKSKSSSSRSKSTSSSSSSSKTERIYVDGASRGNGRSNNAASGYGVYYGENDSRNAAVALNDVDDTSKYIPTNQRAELHGMKHALTNIKNDLINGSTKRSEIYSDSKYAMQSVNEWSTNWEKNGYKTSTGNKVANSDLIKESVNLKNDINKIYESKNMKPLEFVHVKGHSGNEGNEAADRLANQGADKMSRGK
ncbi:uncharacterized protein KGF55_003700 [Candida pseudojiufengensis]|uniref:uncharacterized protein n=1 Tax=Candida pseudojiufengensis TaxID=497109 RepID=UPI002224FB37|nr:uncharacterized protein KGF55_003700 [Candida pseudojiufengensis]KAI5962624.1 hypothetical protein KGF55_003700 [Candida pseudojiufengensis]